VLGLTGNAPGKALSDIDSIHHLLSRTGENPPSGSCNQVRLVCSAGDRPARAKVRALEFGWQDSGMAGNQNLEVLEPNDKVSLGEITSHRAVTTVNAMWPRKA
jgi:hypothetical protein